MNRFTDVTEDVYKVLSEIKDELFSDLQNAKIKCLFDTKKRMKGGKVVLASIKKTNDLLRCLTAEEAKVEEGFDYIITIDMKAWQNIDAKDRTRLLRHELRHTFVNDESEKDPYKLVDHDISDFAEEIKLNHDDVNWAKRVSTLVMDIYDQEKEMEKAAKKKKKSKKGKSYAKIKIKIKR